MGKGEGKGREMGKGWEWWKEREKGREKVSKLKEPFVV